MAVETLSYARVADQKRLKFITDNIRKALGEEGTILDVGCGNGIISSSLGRLGYGVTGIDVSEKAIQKAKENNNLPNVHFEVLSAENLQVQNKVYDAIICSEVLEHLHFPLGLLNVLYHLLSEKGIMIVTVPNGYGPRELLVTKPSLSIRNNALGLWKGVHKFKSALGYDGSTIQSEADNLDHIQFFSKKDIYTLAEKSGFKISILAKTNFIDDVFPFSLITRRSTYLQKIDASMADMLPYNFTGGFVSVWTKR
jgi:SAM-dependent methyltransferase